MPTKIRNLLHPVVKKVSPFLRPVIVAFETRVKPIVEMFVFYEALVDLYFTMSVILCTWLMSSWNWSFLWPVLMGVAIVWMYRQNYRRLRSRVRDELARDTMKAKLTTDFESVEWMNMFMTRFWMMFGVVILLALVSG